MPVYLLLPKGGDGPRATVLAFAGHGYGAKDIVGLWEDGSERLPVKPLTLNAPFPTTRSGICKITFLVKAKINTDYQALFSHWLHVHVPNVASTMRQAGGFRYVVSHSLDPEREPYAGMAELYFDDLDGWRRYKKLIKADGMEQWTEEDGTLVLRSQTEMIGIP